MHVSNVCDSALADKSDATTFDVYAAWNAKAPVIKARERKRRQNANHNQWLLREVRGEIPSLEKRLRKKAKTVWQRGSIWRGELVRLLRARPAEAEIVTIEGILPLLAKSFAYDCDTVGDWLFAHAPAFAAQTDPLWVRAACTHALDKPPRYHPDRCAEALGVTKAERDALGLTMIGATDFKRSDRLKARRAKNAAYHRQRRARAGAQSYAASRERQKPWKALGISRATYYRRRDAREAYEARVGACAETTTTASAETTTTAACVYNTANPFLQPATKPEQAATAMKGTRSRMGRMRKNGSRLAPSAREEIISLKNLSQNPNKESMSEEDKTQTAQAAARKRRKPAALARPTHKSGLLAVV